MKAHLAYRSRMAAGHTRCSQKSRITLQKPLKAETERIKNQQIIVHLAVDETLEWCSSFVLVPKANGEVQL